MTRPWLLRAAWWALGAIALLVAATARLAVTGRAELAASDTCWASGDLAGAIVHARSAAFAFVPGAAHVERARARLRGIAEQSEARGDIEVALSAWRALRSASYATRVLGPTDDDRRRAADGAIARLSAASRRPDARSGAVPARTSARAMGALLAADAPPHAGLGLLLLAGVAFWVAGGYWFASRGWDPQGKGRLGELRRAFALGAAGGIAWIIGLFLM